MINKPDFPLHNKHILKSDGFTLVELAIVMIIIGLLIGGILKGQELILNARIHTLITNVNSYRSATLIFQDNYKAFPGDLKNAGAKLPGCTNFASCLSAGGDQNGIIGTKGLTDWDQNNQGGLTTEPTQFWVQLSVVDLIGGISKENRTAWGAVYPASPMGGGFHVLNAGEASVDNPAFGHYFALRVNPTGNDSPYNTGVGLLTPSMAARVDRITDDGIPNAGQMITDDNGYKCWAKTVATYNTTNNNSKICMAAFKF